MPTTLRLIDHTLVRRLLPMARCVELMREAFVQVSERRALQPIRQVLRTPDGAGLLGWMPGFTDGPPRFGVKLITVFPGAVAKGAKSHQGFVMLFDGSDGRPLCVIDAGEVTAIRTAASTAVASGALARADARTLSLFGCGEQAHTHLQAMLGAHDYEEVRIWARDSAKAERFVEREQPLYKVPLRVETDPERAAGADVICTLTGSADPIFKGAWLKPGQHLNAVGASIALFAEIDNEAVTRSRYFTDDRASALVQAGELKRAREAGLVGEDHIKGEIGEVLTGKVEGRRSDEDITLFKSLGMATEDLLACGWILDEAQRQGLGATIDW